MPLPKISVITPSYNQGEFLERTILSVLSQKYPRLEYIILDGGSTDNSVGIIKKYRHHLHYWHSRSDKGQWHAIEQGLNMASGDILCWLNSDDVFLPYTLNLVGQLFSKFPIDWLTSQSVIINDHDQIVRTGIQFGKLRSLIRVGFYHGKFLGFIPQEGTFWSKKLWQKSGSKMPHLDQCLDFRLWQKFAKYSPLVNLEAPLGAFRYQSSQKTSQHTHYYREINRLLAYLPPILRLMIGRPFAPLSRLISPRIYFDRSSNKWMYQP